ncbi:MFS transporter [Haloarchaeobius amylolyticus]|uniref:dolichyl-phosphooligosaccharide-protein glycotransferase n=1 Tax=Haloarchaeobius amylolyticus TaxID=1198296 RepID=A0ABD6BCN0_9EURY
MTADDLETVQEFLDDRSDGETVLEAVLAVDADHGTWTFDDVDLDSGTFGELVSRGIVTKVDGAYRVADPAVVESVLTGKELDEPTDDNDFAADFNRFWNDVDLRALAGLFGALLVVAAARMTAYQSVFQNGYVVSPANDPYYFRYWMENLLEKSSGPTDYGVLVEPSAGVAARRPLAHATNWFVAELLGGGQGAADTVAAQLPVVASVVLGLVIYKLTVLLTRDIRVGVASVLVFAVTPIHAVYTGLGFIDHQLHQYFWLGITLLTLAWLAVDLQRRLASSTSQDTAVQEHLQELVTWAVAVAFGLSVAAGTHTWGGSPLLLIPLAGYVGLRVALDVRARVSPARANLPLLVGLAVGSILSLILHYRWGWHATFVAATPTLVLGGATAVTALGEVWYRLKIRSRGLLALEGGVAAGGLLVFRVLRPADWTEVTARLDDLFLRSGATETLSLFSTEYAVFFGPMYQLGMGFYVALIALGWVVWLVTRRYKPGWLLVGTYATYLLILAGVQVRFAGQLAIPLAVLTGLGLVQLLAVVDLARTPVPFQGTASSLRDDARDGDTVATDGGQSLEPSISIPDGRKIGYVVGIGLLILGLSLIYVPGLTADVTHSESQVEAASAIDDHAAAADRTYPENFVLSEWGDNRMYNYLVSGESRTYSYAQNNYMAFQASDPDSWYDQFEGRVGYVVTEVDGKEPAEKTQVRLLKDLDSDGNDTDGLAHYQAILVDDDVAAFAVVPGATIRASGAPGETVVVSTNVTVGDESFIYERGITIEETGHGEVTVPYSGEYSIDDRQVAVSEEDVLNGTVVELEH